MFHSDSESKTSDHNPVAEISTADKISGKRQGFPSLRREPSFSGWCDSSKLQNDRELLEKSSSELDKEQEGESDIEFELPLLNQDRVFGSSTSSLGSFSMETNELMIDGENENRKYVPFGVENGSRTERQKPEKVVSPANVLKTLFCIMLWYTFSLFLTMYNKALLGDHLGKFPAPLLMNTFHFAMQAVLSRAITWYWSDKFQTDVTMSWKDYFTRVVPTALATALDVNLSNLSLVFISVTFATMCKSAAPIFLILFAFAFRLESPSFKLFGIILVISFGVMLTVAKETEFELWGFIFVMLAAVMSGFRWCMTQILLQNPLVFMSVVTPIMAIATGLLSLVMDPWYEFAKNVYFNSSRHVLRSFLLMLFGGTLAFFMVLVEFILISVTSAVTVTIAGVVKEALTIMVAVFYFHDEFTWLKGVGLLIIILGVSLFNWYKYLKLQTDHDGAKNNPNRSVTTEAKYVILDKMDDQNDSV
ncbi:hypothetical protein V2J09_002743 [Rumex salicifolius]